MILADNADSLSSLAIFLTQTRLEDVPAEVVDKAKLILLDTLGVAIAGFHTRAAGITKAKNNTDQSPGMDPWRLPKPFYSGRIDSKIFFVYRIPFA